MSNQRAGNWKPATLRDENISLSTSEVIKFSRTAKEMLQTRGEDDAAFYFEQIEDWLVNNPGKGLRDAGRVLGL